MNLDVAVVGAGVSGLACARVLTDAGRSLMVLERSRGVGGRCATRRIQGQAVDHGVAFLHGSDPEFVRAIRHVDRGTVIEGWPSRIAGSGPPCQPEAFERGAERLAYAEGITVFPKSLMRGVDIRLGSNVTELSRAATGETLVLTCEDGWSATARHVVLGLPATSAARLLARVSEESRDAAAARALLRLVSVVPTLAVIAGYPRGGPVPEWQILYPENSSILQLVTHDSDKRPDPRYTVLVMQARPHWSDAHGAEPPEVWSRAMIEETARRVGRWVADPEWTDVQRWRHARVAGDCGMARPLLVRFGGDGAIGLAGESLGPVGGVETAWLSGRALARRIIAEG